MIHSMFGGVISENSPFLCAKVESGEARMWFLAPFPVSAGEKVLAPFPSGEQEGVVLKTEFCTGQTSPVPVRALKALLKKLP